MGLVHRDALCFRIKGPALFWGWNKNLLENQRLFQPFQLFQAISYLMKSDSRDGANIGAICPYNSISPYKSEEGWNREGWNSRIFGWRAR